MADNATKVRDIIEKEFNIDIPDEDAEKLRTVGDAVAYLDQKVGA